MSLIICFILGSNFHESDMENNLCESLLEYSNNTVQAGDPSLFMKGNNFDYSSLLSLNNDYDKLLEENYIELKTKCLNNLNQQENRTQEGIKTDSHDKKQMRLTHVKVHVPSNKFENNFANSTHDLNDHIKKQVHKNFRSG